MVADPRALGTQCVHDFPTCCLSRLAQEIHRILQQDERVPQEVNTGTQTQMCTRMFGRLLSQQPKLASSPSVRRQMGG